MAEPSSEKSKKIGRRIAAGTLGALIGIGSATAFDRYGPSSQDVSPSLKPRATEVAKPTKTAEVIKNIDTNISYSDFLLSSPEKQKARLKELLGKDVTLTIDHPDGKEVWVDQWPYNYSSKTETSLGLEQYTVKITEDKGRALWGEGVLVIFVNNEQYEDFRTNWWGLKPEISSHFFQNKHVILPRGTKFQLTVDDSPLNDGRGNIYREPRLTFKSITLPNQ